MSATAPASALNVSRNAPPRREGRRTMARLATLVAALLLAPAAAAHRDHAPAPAAAPSGDAARAAPSAPLRAYTGRVDTLTVIDRTVGLAWRYPRLLLADGTRVQLEGLQLPPDGSYVTVTGRLADRTLSAELVQAATDPASMARAAVTRGQLEGTLRVFHVDYPDGTAEYGYALRTANGRGNIVALGHPPASIDNGARAVVSGPVNERGYISVDTIEITAPPAATKPALADSTAALGTTKYTVMPLKYPSNTSAPWTYNADPGSWSIAAIQSAVLGSGTGSAADYYAEVSFGAQQLEGVVANAGNAWLKATAARPTACTSESELDAVLASIESQGEAAATTAGFNPDAYDGQLYVIDGLPCGWAGLGYIGFPLAYTKGTASLIVVAHELGHNFGLYHAGSVDCGGDVITGSGCTVKEYGDPFDVMGNVRAMHFNAAQKSLLGYIGGTGVATHSTGTATYTLNPIELAGQARYAVKVPTGSANRTYWIEFRQPIGFDSALAGVPNLGAQIRIAYPFENQCTTCGSRYDDTQFLDMTPATGTFDDGALLANQSFTDAQHGITITVTSASPSALDVKVSTGGGGGGGGATSSTTAVASGRNPSMQGQSVTFTATVAGAAPSGTVAFRDGGAAIASCGAVALTGSGGTRTATCTTSQLQAGSHAISASYAGDANNTSSQSTNLTQTVNAAATPVPTATRLSSSANPAPSSGAITLTATIDAATPVTGGNVQFTSNGVPITGCGSVPVSTGGPLRTAHCVAQLASGAFTIVARYSGVGMYEPSSSLPFAQVRSLSGIGNTVQFASATYAVNENASNVAVVVTRIGDVTAPAVVSYATSPGTATSAEFQATSGTLTWVAQDSTPRTIVISMVDDVGAEPDKTFSVSLSSPSGTVLGAVATTTVTVVDNEGAPTVMPASATIVQNPYGAPNVIGAVLAGNAISGFTRSVDIELGTIAGATGSFARIDLQGLSIGPGNTLRIRSGAVGQTVHLVNVSAANADIGGLIVAIPGNGAPPPALVVQSAPGIALGASGRVSSPSGLTMSALYADITTGNPLLNQGTIEGGPALALKAARVNGGGIFRGNTIAFTTFGNLNNPANGAHFVANGLQLHPASGSTVAVSIAGYGVSPQVYNLMVNGDATLSMPSVWPAGSPLPPTNRPVLPNGVRAAGIADPAYGGGQIIVQAAGTLRLDGGASHDFVFPGGFVLKSNGALDLNGTVLVNGWTTSGTTYQGIFLEAPSIVDSSGAVAASVYTNDLNWANLSVRPALPLQTATLRRQNDGTAQYGGANALAPHLNFYALVTEAGAAGLCYICLVNTTVTDFSIVP